MVAAFSWLLMHLQARQQQPVDLGDALHLRLRGLGAPAGGQSAQSGP